MTIRTLFVWSMLTALVAADVPGDMFDEAQRLARSGQKSLAMAKVEEAVAMIDRAHAAGEKISWEGRNGVRFAARLAREDFLDYDKSFFFCNKLLELADTDDWKVSARLERARTFRVMKDYKKAQQEYDLIARADEGHRPRGLLPQAMMVYFEIGDKKKGQALIESALMNEAVNGYERFAAIRDCVEEAMTIGRRDQALAWYAKLEKLPYSRPEERSRYLAQAWFEMGKIEESCGRTARAKALYRRAMEEEKGEMHHRAWARNALEAIEYFE